MNSNRIFHAFNANKNNRHCCTLVLATGNESAAIASLLFDRDYYGILPLERGMLPNVRNMFIDRIKANGHVKNIVKAMGLKRGKTYKSTDKLNYGSILILTEDNDMSVHIIALIVNFFHYYWPELLQRDNFVASAEIMPSDLQLHNLITYYWSKEHLEDGTNSCDDAIRLVFDPKRVDDRAQYYNKKITSNNSNSIVSFGTLMKSVMDNYYYKDILRSIPSITDGSKSLQRVIFKKFIKMNKKHYSGVTVQKLYGELVKSGFNYDISTLQAILKKMSNDMTNNIPLINVVNLETSNLYQGEHHNRGNIITFSPYYEFLFGSNNLNQIIPLVLVNESFGISLGYSTQIYQCHPIEVCDNLIRLLNDQELLPMKPWFRNFSGRVEKIDDEYFLVSGLYQLINDCTIHVTELTPNFALGKYLNYLDSLLDSNAIIGSYTEKCTSNKIDITINLQKPIDPKNMPELVKYLKLSTRINIKNMHLVATDGSIKKYNSYNEILIEYFLYNLLQTYDKLANIKTAKEIWLDDLNKFKCEYQKIN